MTNSLLFSFASIWPIFLALLVLLFMITIHEFGHYIVAKIFDFKVNEFAIGMGPAIFKKKKKNGEYFSIRLLPLGGYCAFEGEDDDASDPRAFNNKKPWQRILVLIAGATMNFLSAILIFIIAIGIYGQNCVKIFETNTPSVMTDTLKSGDTILSINNHDIYLTTDLASALKGKKKNDIVDVVILRNKQKVSQQIRLLADPVSQSMQDLNGVLQSLGVATSSGITKSSNTEQNWLLEGDIIHRVSRSAPTLIDGINSEKTPDGYVNIYVPTYFEGDKTYSPKKYFLAEKDYLSIERTYYISDFYNFAKTFNDGETIYVYVIRGDKVMLVNHTFSNFTDEIKADENKLSNYFNIKGDVFGYRMISEYVKFGFFETISRGFMYAFKNVGATFTAIGQLFTGQLGLEALGGPITTISLTSQVASMGFSYLLEIAGFIGVSLAIFNLLPIPALDGARVVFVIIEWIRKKPINRNVEGMIHSIGLLLLLVFAFSIDLIKCL